LKVNISHTEKDAKGFVVYSEQDKSVEISLPDPTDESIVEQYFNNVREFKIPESPRIDDYRVDKVKPIESETYFRLALCTLHAGTGFWVHWETMEE